MKDTIIDRETHSIVKMRWCGIMQDQRVWVAPDGSGGWVLRVYDDIAGHYVRPHSVSYRTQRDIIRRVASTLE